MIYLNNLFFMHLYYIEWWDIRDDNFYVKKSNNKKWYPYDSLLSYLLENIRLSNICELRTQNISEYNEILKLCNLFWITIPQRLRLRFNRINIIEND